jgi:hypothetical protein
MVAVFCTGGRKAGHVGGFILHKIHSQMLGMGVVDVFGIFNVPVDCLPRRKWSAGEVVRSVSMNRLAHL